MTRLLNDPRDFVDQFVAGFMAASSRWVHPVPGGVLSSTRGMESTVAVVIGGGSGHYPAFAGLVGPGLAHGAVVGNVFASPSAHQVQSVAEAAHEGRGVLLAYGNYAGDVLHFTQAQARMRQAGIDCRTVIVTDDISSAPINEREKRRGIAGDLVVFKIAGGAAAAGYDLDGVERVASLANDRTRSLGVAFGGCTLPGFDEPLFTVPEGRMAVGLGIHGEPGIDEVDIPTASGLAELLVTELVRDLPEGVQVAGSRVVPIINGLGTVKYEELFLLYGAVNELLTAAGALVVWPEVGEFCTSFDMAGVSLSLFWLEDELERLWLAPCDTPSFRRGSVSARVAVTEDQLVRADEYREIGRSSPASQGAAALIARALFAVATMLEAHADELGRLDRVAGDGDHGIGMQRGSRAAAIAAGDAAAARAGAGTLAHRAGDAWANAGGGTSGAIWGEMLIAFGQALGDTAPVNASVVGRGVTVAKDAVMSFGKATVGDKTMIDAIVPFADALEERLAAGEALAPAWKSASDAAATAAQQTAKLSARLGRARSHGDKSRGTPDPGAVSFALVTHTVLDVLMEV